LSATLLQAEEATEGLEVSSKPSRHGWCTLLHSALEQLLVGPAESSRAKSARTQVRARGDILSNGARPQLSKAVVVYGRVGAGIKGVQPPSRVST